MEARREEADETVAGGATSGGRSHCHSGKQQTRSRESDRPGDRARTISPLRRRLLRRGQIRSIAEVVGTDPAAALIGKYDEEHGPPGTMRAAQICETDADQDQRAEEPCNSGGG